MMAGGDDSPAAIAAVEAAASAGVATFVVGIGANTGAEQTLSLMALGGTQPNTVPGQPAYFPVTSTQDLVDVLENAALRVTRCAYPLRGPPPDADLVTITGAAGLIPRDQAHRNGWDYGADGESVIFYGD